MKKKVIKYFPIIILLITICIMAFIFVKCSFLIHNTEDIRISPTVPSATDEGWVDMSTGEFYDEDRIILEPGESLVISHIIPYSYSTNTFEFAFFNPGLYTIVSVGNKDYLEDGAYENIFGKELDAHWTVIKVTSDMNGKNITLNIQNNTKLDKQFEFKKIVFGSPTDISSFIFFYNIRVLIESVVIIIIGIFLTLYGISRNRVAVNSGAKQFIHLGLTTLFFGMWMYFNTQIYQFVTGNPNVRITLSFFCYYFLTVSFANYAATIVQKGKITIRFMEAWYLIAVSIVLILYIVNNVPLRVSSIALQIYEIAMLITIMVIFVVDYKDRHTKNVLYSSMAFIVMIVGLAVYSLSYLSGTNINVLDFYNFCFIAFTVILLLTTFRENYKEYANQKTLDSFRELVFEDPVTGGNSRQYLETQMKSLSSQDHFFVFICMLELPTINKLIGHDLSRDLFKNLYWAINKALPTDSILSVFDNHSFTLYLSAQNEEEVHIICKDIDKNIARVIKNNNLGFLANNKYVMVKLKPNRMDYNHLMDDVMIAIDNDEDKMWTDIPCYVYDEEYKEKIINGKYYLSHLDEAMENGELTIYFQPLISFDSSLPKKAEAFARWIHPKFGITTPDNFVPIFIKNGLIGKLDLYIFSKVCEWIHKEHELSSEIPVISINISEASIESEHFLDPYIELMQKYQVKGSEIEFEITGNPDERRYETIAKTVEHMHEHDIRCSMDNFGKPYSNMNELAAVPFDTVMMDKRFFEKGYPKEKTQRIYVESAIKMLKTMEFGIVAEGIESKEVSEALHGLGVDYVQGYYFSSAMSIAEFERYLDMESLRL